MRGPLMAALVIVGALTYLPTWDAPFAADDYLYLEAVARSHGLGLLRYLWGEGVMDHHYRPLSDPLFFALARSPALYHLLLQLLHCGTACLTLALGLRLGLGWAPAFLGALLWVTRDFTYPSMVWGSGISDIGAACLAMISVQTYLRWRESGRLPDRIASAGALVGAVLTKETAVVTVGLFPLLSALAAASAPSWSARIAGLLRGQWWYWVSAVPLAVLALARGRFEEAYGQEIYTLSVGPHTLGLWPLYWFWSFLGLREALFSSVARSALYVAAALVLGLLVVLRLARPSNRLTAGMFLGVGWFTVALLPALFAPQRVLINYLALAAVGPALSSGLLLGWMIERRSRLLRLGGCVLAAVAVAAGPALVIAKERGRFGPGGWVHPAPARRMAEFADWVATKLAPEPASGAVLVVFAEPYFTLAVLGDPDGKGFRESLVLRSAIRWRSGRADIETIVLPAIPEASSEDLRFVRDLLRRVEGDVRVLDATGPPRDVTGAAQQAAMRATTVAEFRRALVAP